ncbi:pectinesterase inhibitor 9-like [Herrania umbratica]|uniref:Pectinesterase inhibitor 9-like n=1 Tax=Herrania umbratica TaxID=108875 RepID=A0A6J1B8W3_9ROSI|nr:pectinesterase inhibitor 9-like [Herrania umbratica]XP_021295877.1 pectinesterase inhibitor 9-like [Herrania umbratica]
MARLAFSVLVLFCALYMTGIAASASPRNSSPADYIVASCKATRYPALCAQCLSGYASKIRQNEQHLAQTALSVSLSKAQSAAAFVTKMTQVRGIKPRERQAVKDCIENMGDSVERLSQSVKELSHVGRAVGRAFMWHMSNVQTWVSAALTDENTCLDGFAGRVMDGNIKTTIRRRVVNVAQVTSNALALVNHLAARHGAAAPAGEH